MIEENFHPKAVIINDVFPMSGINIGPGLMAAYYVGKPNPLMMRHALKKLGADRTEAAIIGDRMDTDMIAGIESELDTVLVLSGVIPGLISFRMNRLDLLAVQGTLKSLLQH